MIQIPDSATVYTPPALAAAMVKAARGHLGALWLDPCVGDGAFVAEIAKLGVASDQIFAVDIAPFTGAHDGLAQTTRNTDFLEWAQDRRASVDHVIMNPPYVALSRVRGRPLERALEIPLFDGRRLPLKANYWCAFVLRALECVRPKGSMLAVLPASWDFARYAVRVRQTFERAFGEVIVVRCASPLFSDVKEGAVVVAGFQRGTQPCTVHRVEVADLGAAVEALGQIGGGRPPQGASIVRRFPAGNAANSRLDELIEIRIGAVTGDADYFLLTERERSDWGLPRSAVKPVLSRRKHLSGATVGIRDWEALRDAGARIWLFRPPDSVLDHPAVKEYLHHAKQGGCNLDAFKVASRNPWHRTPLPRRVDGFLSGMSKRLPFLTLRAMEGLTATNTLYVVRFKRRATPVEKATLGILLLTSSVRRELERHARVYADGLLKFEPTELGSIRVPVVCPRRDAAEILHHATALLLAGREEDAIAKADEWVSTTLVRKPDRGMFENSEVQNLAASCV